ncbi:hypothetical protein [Pseudobacteroides cellulosolvens]|uniref:Uncharacterized protein n=1 Tax=Pseudobacteroides cellulosolvens ATCC 35603 = DSM 2933 TaxID=398512 RepID=A0A0L6JIE2_9FIRM|nr:hypothetical protein [Pseudobacteroides cellulosolvens]KNY25495.1 hypothetical protein Bccel_0755 [Pseudobacteroides cellulosolvens ATCC 35603 = DSM 2933]
MMVKKEDNQKEIKVNQFIMENLIRVCEACKSAALTDEEEAEIIRRKEEMYKQRGIKFPVNKK